MIRRTGRIWMAAMVLTWPLAQACAQTMYRCGNAYQDRPCESSQPAGRVVGSVGASPGTPPGGASAPAKDPVCAQRGADALKIIWARDSGVTQEQQLAETDRKGLSAYGREQELQLIESVYRKRGSTPDIRAAVEAECGAERERAAQAAALAAAAVRLQGGLPAAPAVAPRTATDAGSAPQDARTNSATSTSAQEQDRASRCAGLTQQGEAIRRQERAGGNASAMERLLQQRRDIEARQRRDGC